MINKLCVDFRPLGKVLIAIDSPNKRKEQMITLMPTDKELRTYKKAKQLLDKSKKFNLSGKMGIYAVPVNSKLPYMMLKNLPEEYVRDIQEGKNPQHRYYLGKIECWNEGFNRPLFKIESSIGEAGNLDAESLRILKTYDICTDEYEAEGSKTQEAVHESLRVFTKNLDPVT